MIILSAYRIAVHKISSNRQMTIHWRRCATVALVQVLVGCADARSSNCAKPVCKVANSREQGGGLSAPSTRDSNLNAPSANRHACKGDHACATMLARLYTAVEAVRMQFEIPDAAMPSRIDVENYFASSAFEFPKCHLGTGRDYYLANEGPEASKNPHLIAYERNGNHGMCRHIVLDHPEPAIYCVDKVEWERIRTDWMYVPSQSSVLRAHLHFDFFEGE